MHIIFDQKEHRNSEADFFNHVENVINQMKNNYISAGMVTLRSLKVGLKQVS
ncbi:MAG: hypothetical protein ACOCVD_03195 [Bacillota bacterium]